MRLNKHKPLPPPTVAIVTERQIKEATPAERCRLMKEIIRGAKYSPGSTQPVYGFDPSSGKDLECEVFGHRDASGTVTVEELRFHPAKETVHTGQGRTR